MKCPKCRKEFSSVSTIYMHMTSYHKAVPVFLTKADIAFIEKLLMNFGHRLDRKSSAEIWNSIQVFKKLSESGL